jgi:hypothetical protein
MTLAQGLMPVVLAIAVAMKAAERRIVGQLRVAGATEHGRATSIHVRGPIARFRLRRLVSTSSIRPMPRIGTTSTKSRTPRSSEHAVSVRSRSSSSSSPALPSLGR